MENQVEIVKVETEPRRSIPAIAVTAIVMVIALAGIIVLQKTVNAPAPSPQPAGQTDPR
jgi:hypothetical protein